MAEVNDMEKQVLYEDNHIIIVNKKPSQIVQGDKTGDTPLSELLKDYIKVKYNKPGEVFLGVVHRLDRPVSGLVIFARTSKALSRLNEMLKEREIHKTYWAIVKKQPKGNGELRIENGEWKRLSDYLKKNEKQNKSYVVSKDVKGSSKAELEYKTVGESDNYLLFEVKLHTGKHHQIRAQLSNIGYAIKGDVKYGFPRPNPDGSICLHSRKIEFIHPVSKIKIELIAKPPDDKSWKVF